MKALQTNKKYYDTYKMYSAAQLFFDIIDGDFQYTLKKGELEIEVNDPYISDDDEIVYFTDASGKEVLQLSGEMEIDAYMLSHPSESTWREMAMEYIIHSEQGEFTLLCKA